MKVLVTGGTGFVGSHATAALVCAGHQVRLLVRNPARIDRALAPHGIAIDDYTIGDMCDVSAVRNAMSGCDAALHAAATLYGGEDVLDANIRGVRNVLGIGCELGLDPILYISSITALHPPPGGCISTDDPVSNLDTTYGRSKAEGERFARELQAKGEPIVTIYPSGVFGPDDPGPSEAVKGLRDALRFGWPIANGGISMVDVRDVAKIASAVLEEARGPRRFMAGGHFLRWSELADACDALTGRRTRRIPVPTRLLRGVGRALDLARKIVPIDYPLTREAAVMMTQLSPCNSRPTETQLDIQFRPTHQTLTDTIHWLQETTHLSPHLAGNLNNSPRPAR